MDNQEMLRQPESSENQPVSPVQMQPGQPPIYTNNIPIGPQRTAAYLELLDSFMPIGIGCLLYGILFTISLYKGFHGISMPVLTLVTLIGLMIIREKMDKPFKKTDCFYMVGIELLGISSFLTGDYFLLFFNVCGILLLTLGWLLSGFCNTAGWGFPKYLQEVILAVFTPVGYLDGFFKSLNRFFTEREKTKNSKAKYIWIGILFGIPFVIIVTALLTSADAVFNHMFTDLFDKINFPEHPIWMFFLFITSVPGSFALLAYFADKKEIPDTKDHRTLEPVIAITFLSFSTVVYLIFSVVQILYLFIGGFTLPDGYTYATYAHEGFYQLLAVCLLNLIVLFICIGKFKENRILKALLSVFSVCTCIMLCSSVMRMILYVQVYQLTFLRFLTLWGLIVIGLVLTGCFITIWKNTFPLFSYTMIVVSIMYIMMSLSRPQYLIAKYNLSDPNNTADMVYLTNLGPDAVPAYINSPEFKQTDNNLYSLSHYQEVADEMGITDFNVSYYTASKLLYEKLGKIE